MSLLASLFVACADGSPDGTRAGFLADLCGHARGVLDNDTPLGPAADPARETLLHEMRASLEHEARSLGVDPTRAARERHAAPEAR